MNRPAALPVTALLAVLALLLAAGCTGGSPHGSSAPSRTTSRSAAVTSAAPPPAPPPRDACYRLSPDQLTRPSNSSAAVPCTARHTARTIYVGHLDTVVHGHSVGVGSDVVRRQLAGTCPRKLASYLGGSTSHRHLSRFNVVWFSPTPAQSDRGAAWFRCDLIAFARADSLLDLPEAAGRKLEGVLDRPGTLDTYGLCGTAAPGSHGFERVACARKHSWKAVGTISLKGGRAYPGVSVVREAGDSACKAEARSRAADTLKFKYGWEWPTREQWSGGQHFGYCWVPARG